MSSISELIKQADSGNLQINVTVSLSDLREFIEEVACSTASQIDKAVQDNKRSELLTTLEVCKALKVSRATLERWKKSEYLVPIKIGGKCFYHPAIIESIKKG